MKLCPEGARRTKTEPCLCGNDGDYDLKTSINPDGETEIYITCGACGHDPAQELGRHYVSRLQHPERGIDPLEVHRAGEIWNSSIRMEREGITPQDIVDTMPENPFR